jgi:hypothetical protein
MPSCYATIFSFQAGDGRICYSNICILFDGAYNIDLLLRIYEAKNIKYFDRIKKTSIKLTVCISH